MRRTVRISWTEKKLTEEVIEMVGYERPLERFVIPKAEDGNAQNTQTV